MTYRGHIKNGMVVLDGEVTLPEGCEVRVDVLATPASDTTHEAESDEGGKNGRQRLVRYAGIAKDMPADAARNLDHYLYGHPRQ